jgi:glycosyltransferase involved in cell wall biosynthesis
MKRCKPTPRQADVSFQLQLPNEWNPKLASKLNIGITAAVETDRASLEWVTACEKMDHVVFPSEHAKKSITNAGWAPKPGQCLVIPESFPDALCDSPNTSILNPLPVFTFFVFGQMTGMDNGRADRKNLHNTLKWLLEEFAGDEDVGILLKTNQGRHTTFDAYHTENVLKNIIKDVKTRVTKTLPEVHLIHGDLDDTTVATMYKHPNVKALVSATRGEGFGLPLLEAAACDLPVIATGWSAHTEFLSLGRYVDLPYTLQNVPKERIDGKIFVPNSKWAEVSEQDFKRRVKKFRQSSNIPREWAKELGVKIRANYSQDAIAAKLSETFEDKLRKISG